MMLTDNTVIINGSWESDAFNAAVRLPDSARSSVVVIANIKVLSGKSKSVVRHVASRLRCGLAKRSGSALVLLSVAGSRVPKSAIPTGAAGSQSLLARTPRTTDGERQCSSAMTTSVFPVAQQKNWKHTTLNRGHGFRHYAMRSKMARRYAGSATKNTPGQSSIFGLLSSNTASTSLGGQKSVDGAGSNFNLGLTTRSVVLSDAIVHTPQLACENGRRRTSEIPPFSARENCLI